MPEMVSKSNSIKKQIDLSILKRDKSKSAVLNFCFSATDLIVKIK